jgi:hypothetical protein
VYWRKEHLRTLLESEISFEAKIKLSKDLFVGKKAYIVAAGPSLNNVDFEKLGIELADSLVICIKQSIVKVKNHTDIMLINFCNLSEYNWDLIDCPVFWTTFAEDHGEIIKNNKYPCSEIFKATGNGKNNADGFKISTAGGRHWDRLGKLIEGEIVWGPGLMYELAIPLALHLGVNEIVLVSWDIGTLNENTEESFMNNHFYDQDKLKLKTKINNLEIEVVAESTNDLKIWLENRGVSLSVISNSSLVDSGVRRRNEWLK